MLVEKEGGDVRARGLGGGRRCGRDASGQAGEVCWWRAAWERAGLASESADVEMRVDEANRERSRDPLILSTEVSAIFPGSSDYKILGRLSRK